MDHSVSARTQHKVDQALDQALAIHHQDTQLEQKQVECQHMLKQLNAVLVAHYYTDASLQALADETGGCVSDSLEMARFGAESTADIIIVAGVKFMGETAKILTPHKRVLMPTLEATCSLDLGCPIDEFNQFCDEHPGREIVVYANTSAAVKARADWVVTSSIALQVVEYLDQQGKKILWAPDRYLGDYVQRQTGADMITWQGSCVVHEEFKAKGLVDMQAVYPEAAVLVHPESPAAVIELADVVGSTSQLIAAGQNLPNQQFIVATDRAIFYKMQQAAPGKQFIAAPTGGSGATCKSCAHCPWMAMNSIHGLHTRLQQLVQEQQSTKQLPTPDFEIILDQELIVGAKRSLDRMLSFRANL